MTALESMTASEILAENITKNIEDPATKPGTREELGAIALFLTSLGGADLEEPLSENMKMQAVVNFCNERAVKNLTQIDELNNWNITVGTEREFIIEELSASLIMGKAAEALITR